MANLELSIDQQSFGEVGVRADFDADLYAKLIDGFAIEPDRLATVSLRRYSGWNLGLLERARKRVELRGNYDARSYYQNGELDIVCGEDTVKANKTLLHQTKNFIDDQEGLLKKSHSVRRIRFAGIAGSFFVAEAAAGYVIQPSVTHNPELLPALGVALSVPGVALIQHFAYAKAPDEIRAREFSQDPDILESYGQIITYEHL
jgi:hypothetical protein